MIKTDFTPYKERLKNTIILNNSFEKVIKKFDSENTFFYLDPLMKVKRKKITKIMLLLKTFIMLFQNLKANLCCHITIVLIYEISFVSIK
jgi:site-specific DNA-adenine methylase